MVGKIQIPTAVGVRFSPVGFIFGENFTPDLALPLPSLEGVNSFVRAEHPKHSTSRSVAVSVAGGSRHLRGDLPSAAGMFGRVIGLLISISFDRSICHSRR